MKVGIGGFLFVSIFRESWEEHVQMYTSQQETDFNLRVGLDNSYYNCFYLMPRVEKSFWYIFKKRALATQYTVLYIPVSTRKNSAAHFLTFSTRLQEFFCCVYNIPAVRCGEEQY